MHFTSYAGIDAEHTCALHVQNARREASTMPKRTYHGPDDTLVRYDTTVRLNGNSRTMRSQ